MYVSEPRRALPRLFSMLLVSAAVAVMSVPAARSAAPPRSLVTTARTPTDVYRGQQWTLDALHLPRAWHYSRGNGVTVAVLDTGVDGHQPDLVGRVIDGPDFTGHVRRPGSRYWGRHGTQMASIIAGHGHGPGGSQGIMGIAPDAKILSIRVTWELNDPMRSDRAEVDGSRDAIAEGIRYAADHGAQVISMSLGGGKLFYDGNPLEESAISYALSKGVVLVASAGNDGSGPNRRNYPAAYPGVIAVGAVDRAFKPAKFTNRHAYVSVAAPGVEIVSADVSGHGYVLGTGTSPSAAFVAGISALVKARYPRLTPAEVKEAIEQGATHRPPDGRDDSVGTGVADALGAIRAAARINKAEHGGAAVRQPAAPSATAAPRPVPAANSGPDLMLVAVLSGGGTLMVLSLILGWRQRRRRLVAERAEDDDDLLESPVAAGVSARRSVPAASRSGGRSSGPSPWEPRPSDTSPWEPRPSGVSPWEPRPPAQGRSSGTSPWELQPSAERRPASSWEPRTAGRGQGPSGTSSWEPRPSGAGAPSGSSSWDRHEDEPSSSDSAPPVGSSWPTESASSWRSRLSEASSWDAGRSEGSSWQRPDTTRPAVGGTPRPQSPSAVSPADAAPGLGPSEAGRTPSGRSPDAGPGDDRALTEPFPVGDLPSGGSPRFPSPPGRAPQADDPLGVAEGRPSPAERSSYGSPAEPPSYGEPRAAGPGGDDPGSSQTPEPYDPAARAQPGRRADGRSSGGAVTQDFRAVDASDPLSDGPIESSYDVGAPLAEQSWESIRRGFDRIKEDTRNWGSPYHSIDTGISTDIGTDIGPSAAGSGEQAEPPAGGDDGRT